MPKIKPQVSDSSIIINNLYNNSHGLKPLSQGYSVGAQVKINRFGFREFNSKIDTNKNSWLLLGDSVTMGIGVEADKTFAGILQTLNDSINVLNPSVLGYAIEDYKNLSQHFLITRDNKFKITRVIICWCLNDIYIDTPDFETPGGSLRHFLGDVLKFIRARSRFYMLIKTLLFDRPRSYYLFDEAFYVDNRPELINAVDKIVEIKNVCNGKNIRFDIILLPYEYQIRNLANLKDKPQRQLSNLLSKYGIQTLDPIRFFKEKNINSKNLYLYGDGIHFSETGHQLIGEFLNKYFNCQHRLSVAGIPLELLNLHKAMISIH
ncbi:MAG: SGNH/GDSL hydrolase family protein [bacterium]|nr:SGNH/GDSL hydrolase family protein [bacterium]